MELSESTWSLGNREWGQKIEKMLCIVQYRTRWYVMRWDAWCNNWESTQGSAGYIQRIATSFSVTRVSLSVPITLSISIIPVSLLTRYSSVFCHSGWRWCWEMDSPTTIHSWYCPQSTLLLLHISRYPNPKQHKTFINPKEMHRHRFYRTNTNIDLKKKLICRCKGKTMKPKEDHQPKWKTSSLPILAQPRLVANMWICPKFSFTISEVHEVAKPSVESTYCLMDVELSCNG